jgi:hypothetical protein
MTVSGLTMIKAEHQFRQVAARHAQNNRSEALSFGRLTERSRTLSWCQKRQHLNLKGGPAAKAIPRRCENGA